jgi:hypothetical protein
MIDTIVFFHHGSTHSRDRRFEIDLLDQCIGSVFIVVVENWTGNEISSSTECLYIGHVLYHRRR